MFLFHARQPLALDELPLVTLSLPPDEPLQLPVFSVKTVQSIEIMRQKSSGQVEVPALSPLSHDKEERELNALTSMAVVVTRQWKSPTLTPSHLIRTHEIFPIVNSEEMPPGIGRPLWRRERERERLSLVLLLSS